jgi:DNA-binding CsgD family transcriptional regulator
MTSASSRPVRSLSPRLLPVLRLISQGHTHSQAAAQLHLSPRTVGKYMTTAIAELGAQNTPHAVAIAYEAGILP